MKEILIVEDEFASALMLQKLLERCGYQVCGIAQSGEEAISIAETSRPALILMDIQLPGSLDGIDTAVKINETMKIPFVYISGYSDKSVYQRAYKTMPLGYIQKPYNQAILKTTIDMAFSRIEIEEEKAKAVSHMETYRRDLEIMVEKRNNEMKMFRHVVEQSPNAIIITDRDGCIVYLNSKFSELSGYGSDEVVGACIKTPGNPVLPEPDMWDLMISRNYWRGDIYNANKEGELFYGSALVTRITGDDGEVSNYVISIEDTTKIRKDRIEIEKIQSLLSGADKGADAEAMDWISYKEKMTQLNMMRTDRSLFNNIYNSFTQGAGFGSILTLVEMIKSTATRSDEGYVINPELFDIMLKNLAVAQTTFKVLSQIDWIISNDFEKPQMSVTSFHDHVNLIAQSLEGFAAIRHHTIIMNDLPPAFSRYNLRINQEHFEQAIHEVLLNALKFSVPDSTIAVIFNIMNKYLSVSVLNESIKSEEGITGIPEQFEQSIFEPFFRLTKYVFEEYHTLDFGLGLTLVQKIIAKHNGEITVGNIMDHSNFKRGPLNKVCVNIKLPLVQ